MSFQSLDNGRRAYDDVASMRLSPVGVGQLKLDRLLELRAVIDSLRSERGHELLRDVCAARGEIHAP